MIGSKLGSYELEEEIGRGGMGIVYRASQAALARTVAVKVLLPHLAQDGEFVERFLREARAAAKLEHPGVVTIYDVGEFEGTYFFSMRWLQGRPLEEILAEDGALPIDAAVSCAAQVAAALGYAHEAGIIHRDVKPANVILDGSGRAVLTDFGIARAASDTRLTRVGAAVGSPDYMAPEQINGEEIDARADLYALGVLFYHLLTGEPPYTGDAAIAVAYQHLNAPVPSAREARPEVPAELDEVVSKLLAKEPAERYQTAEELLLALSPWEPRTAEIPLRPAGPAGPAAADDEEAAAPPRRSRLAAISLLAAAALAVAGGAYWLTGRGAAAPPAGTAPGPEVEAGSPPGPQTYAAVISVVPDLPDLEVWVNGRDSGQTTPAEVPLEGEIGESLTLELRRDGAVLDNRELSLGPQMELSWAPRLRPPAESLTVTSRPEGARVTLDGEAVGETPVAVELEPGRRYRLSLSLDGHEPAARRLALEELTAEQRESGLHFPLQVSVPPGELVVLADYQVEVRAGGRSQKGTGEVRLSLPPGSHEVRLSAPGVFYSDTETVVIESRQTRELALPQKVSVQLRAYPSNCRVSIGGRDVGWVPTTVDLTIGWHEFRWEWESEGQSIGSRELVRRTTEQIFKEMPE